jgi:Lysyl oxidase
VSIPRDPGLISSLFERSFWRYCFGSAVGTVKKVSAATRAVVGGAVIAAALGIGVVVALDDRRPAAQAEDANASGTGAQSTQPSPSSTSASPTPAGPALLLPNMRSLNPTDLQIEVVGNQRRLRFAASLANFGPGPLLVLPQGRSRCPRGQHPAVQVLHRDANNDGAFQLKGDKAELRRDVGCMLHHPGHKHWHYNAMARYSLRLPGSEEALVARNKVSFCLRDNRRVRVPAQMQVSRQFGRCTRSSQGQGISPGWTDLYKADLKGQWLRLPSGVDGDVLCLDLEADPRGQLTETNEMDNATTIAVRVDGTKVRTVNSTPCR